jgi:hypothetical protein
MIDKNVSNSIEMRLSSLCIIITMPFRYAFLCVPATSGEENFNPVLINRDRFSFSCRVQFDHFLLRQRYVCTRFVGLVRLVKI